MNIIEIRDNSIAILDYDSVIGSVQDMLDAMVSARNSHDCSALVVQQASLGDNFFDLSTGLAGEILQKFSNYEMKLGIVGDFSHYESRSLRDFIYECNRGNRVFFKGSVEEAVEALNG